MSVILDGCCNLGSSSLAALFQSLRCLLCSFALRFPRLPLAHMFCPLCLYLIPAFSLPLLTCCFEDLLHLILAQSGLHRQLGLLHLQLCSELSFSCSHLLLHDAFEDFLLLDLHRVIGGGSCTPPAGGSKD